MASRKRWSYAAGEKGRNRVRVFEDPRTGVIQAEYYEPNPHTGKAKRRTTSLETRDRKEAIRKAHRIAEAFGELEAQRERQQEPTLGALFDIYQVEVTPTKSVGKQKHDAACMELFARFFTPEAAHAALRRRHERGFRWADACPMLPAAINKRHWDRFIRERRAGEIAPAGARTVEVDGVKRPRPVGARQVQYDLQFLRALLNWATVAGEDRGPFLQRSPLAGFKLPREQNPEQPLLYEEEYQAMLAAVAATPARKRKRGAQEREPSRAELARRRLQLVLLNEAGHRGQSVRHLQWSDFDTEAARIRWRAEYDKQRKEHWSPLTPAALEEIRRAQAEIKEIGDAWVFPSPVDAAQPMDRTTFRKWFQQAAATAGVHRPRLGPHSTRRKAATEMGEAGIAPKTAAETLGMSVVTYLTVYQKPNEDHQRAAQAARKPLRASGHG